MHTLLSLLIILSIWLSPVQMAHGQESDEPETLPFTLMPTNIQGRWIIKDSPGAVTSEVHRIIADPFINKMITIGNNFISLDNHTCGFSSLQLDSLKNYGTNVESKTALYERLGFNLENLKDPSHILEVEIQCGEFEIFRGTEATIKDNTAKEFLRDYVHLWIYDEHPKFIELMVQGNIFYLVPSE